MTNGTHLPTNIDSDVLPVKAAVPHMKPGSAIINTSSIKPNADPELLAYATTKGAIANFTAGLAQLVAEKGIRVNAVAPGTDLDAADPVYDVRRPRREIRQGHAAQTARPAGRTGAGLCAARQQ